MTKFLLIASVIGLLSVGVGVGWMTTNAADSVRPDCPGKIECPLTGELVCKDRCPVGSGASEAVALLPPCCR